ncbi:MAG: transglutaminase family protein [Myxococcota bacterium]
MRVRIQHRTSYHYPSPAALGPHTVRLRPAEHAQARLLSYSLTVEPECEVRWQYDPWANRIARLTFEEGSSIEKLTFTVDAAFDIRPVNPFDFFIDDRCEEVPFVYPDGLREELQPFLEVPETSPRLASFVEDVPLRGRTTDYLVALNQKVAATVGYIIRNEPGIQTSDETLKKRSGSCRDSAVLLVDVLRSRGLAARFVSGYLIQLTDEGNIVDEQKGVAEDVVDLHAWAEVYIPGAGWIGLDGTSGLFCGEGHVPLASAVQPELAAAISGTSSVPASDFEFTMDIGRLGHEPRPRRPYTNDAWEAILRLGKDVDRRLEHRGLTLTSGGEPTWTSRLHPALPEWNTEAVGETKTHQGLELARHIQARFGAGTLLLQRAGKQYPGESLPRWAFDLLYRQDGVPLWRDPTRIAALSPGAHVHASLSREFAERLGGRLGVANDHWVPGYEDPWHAIQVEEDLPDDIDPLAADLSDDEERRRLARLLQRGLNTPAGYALPIQWWNAFAGTGGRWITDRWTFRRDRMFLIPGDSPMGLRLPLDRLPGTAPEPYPADVTRSPEPLAFDPRRRQHQNQPAQPVSAPVYGGRSLLRTALCVEVRDGALSVFLPPLPSLEAFVELVAAVEDSAAELEVPVRVEGYPPPADPRLDSCTVTPDPGVVEVNLPVARTFDQYVASLETLSDAANHAHLCTEKFQLDGRQAGSGGGNHLTLGGPSTLESPFLTEPELLSSMLRYFQNHPALSYLFTGLFVGPTSQAPRIDEARLDSLDELELALQQVPKRGEPVFPWTIDRLLRNLLVDVSGNTHRTEICIDKLYAPEGVTGRLGILEFRAFEMPPHERMAAVQMLLLRALVARFAAEPYDAPLVRYGTSLHDRFMLPHFLWRDMEDIVADLRRHAIPIEAEWFRPFLDFRCPVFGTLQVGDLSVELRSALEPWPTLGEEPAGSVVARYVDSSLERIQVRTVGLVEGRHRLTVNGLAVPLHPTGVQAEAVAGIKFRAWQPPHCLQPQIGIHHPLRFDLVDTWGRRSLGACTYHVWHPQGRGFDEPPLTAFEAAARRAQRFTIEGHASYPVSVTESPVHPSHPMTMDLRKVGPARG